MHVNHIYFDFCLVGDVHLGIVHVVCTSFIDLVRNALSCVGCALILCAHGIVLSILSKQLDRLGSEIHMHLYSLRSVCAYLYRIGCCMYCVLFLVLLRYLPFLSTWMCQIGWGVLFEQGMYNMFCVSLYIKSHNVLVSLERVALIDMRSANVV